MGLETGLSMSNMTFLPVRCSASPVCSLDGVSIRGSWERLGWCQTGKTNSFKLVSVAVSKKLDSHCWRSAAHKRFVQRKWGSQCRHRKWGSFLPCKLLYSASFRAIGCPVELEIHTVFCCCFLSVLHVFGCITLFTDGISVTKGVYILHMSWRTNIFAGSY